MKQELTTDIFCDVIDNYGDAGVTYRLASECIARKIFSHIRIFTNDISLFSLIDPAIDPDRFNQRIGNIDYFDMRNISDHLLSVLPRPDVIIEAFGCEVSEKYLDWIDNEGTEKILLNLEYLTAETWAADFHGRESRLGHRNISKFFFMPGFTKDTGGLIVERRFMESLESIRTDRHHRLDDLLSRYGLSFDGCLHIYGILFCYDVELTTLLDPLVARRDRAVRMFVMGEKANRGAMEWAESKGLSFHDGYLQAGGLELMQMGFVPQPFFDELLALVDFAFVRGEDSPVRALIAGTPFIWQRYIQRDGIHIDKTDAFLNEFRKYFRRDSTFRQYYALTMEWNGPVEKKTRMGYHLNFLLDNLEEIGAATASFSRFVAAECDLVENISSFINNKTVLQTQEVEKWE